MGKTIIERMEQLQRMSNVSSIEAECLGMGVGETKSYRIKDLQAYQRLRVRFCRLKESTGRCYITKLHGNKICVSRLEDRKEIY